MTGGIDKPEHVKCPIDKAGHGVVRKMCAVGINFMLCSSRELEAILVLSHECICDECAND